MVGKSDLKLVFLTIIDNLENSSTKTKDTDSKMSELDLEIRRLKKLKLKKLGQRCENYKEYRKWQVVKNCSKHMKSP